MIEKSNDLQQKRGWIQPLLLIVASLYLYLNLFTFRNIPFLLLGDQNFFWTYALRMLHGERLYQDFFQFTPPGVDLVYLAFFRLLGPHIWVTNLVVLLLGVVLCGVCFHLAQRLMDRKLALLAALLFLVYVYADRLDATHHWFSMLAALCAVRVVMPARTLPRIAIAGALLGIASFFTQTTGVAGALALIASLAWERASGNIPWRTILKRQLLLCAAFALVWSLLSAYFLVQIGWRQLWFLQVTYPQHHVSTREFLLPQFHGPLTRSLLWEQTLRLFLYLLLLGIYPPVLWHLWRRRREVPAQDSMQLVLLSLLGLSLLLEIITRVNWNRLYMASMPAILLLLWSVARLDKQRRQVSAALWIVLASVAAGQLWSRQHTPHSIAWLPAGKAAVSTQSTEKLSWLLQHTSPGDLFLQGQGPDLYLPLQLRPPIFVDYLWNNEITRPEYVALTVQQMEREQVKYILWSQPLLSASEQYSHGQDALEPFRTFMSTHYIRVHVFTNGDEIWERR